MFTTLTAEWMILIALVVGVVLVLGSTHRRADRTSWTPADHDHDADRRRTRDELRNVAARRLATTVADIARQTAAATRFDRARAELLEPTDAATERRSARKLQQDKGSEAQDEHGLAA